MEYRPHPANITVLRKIGNTRLIFVCQGEKGAPVLHYNFKEKGLNQTKVSMSRKVGYTTLILVCQPVEEKENSEFKTAKLGSKIDLVSQSSCKDILGQ